MINKFIAACVAVLFACAGCQEKKSPESAPTQPPAKPVQVDAARLIGANSDTANWLSYGRTYDEQRFSPLEQINKETIKELGLGWSLDLDTRRGQEATPLVIDGVMYSTSAWSKVQAIDAASGKLLWQYDPQVPCALTSLIAPTTSTMSRRPRRKRRLPVTLAAAAQHRPPRLPSPPTPVATPVGIFVPALAIRAIALTLRLPLGAIGFDVGGETPGACRGVGYLVKPLTNL